MGDKLRKVLWEETAAQLSQLSPGNASTEITKSLRDTFVHLLTATLASNWTSKVSDIAPTPNGGL